MKPVILYNGRIHQFTIFIASMLRCIHSLLYKMSSHFGNRQHCVDCASQNAKQVRDTYHIPFSKTSKNYLDIRLPSHLTGYITFQRNRSYNSRISSRYTLQGAHTHLYCTRMYTCTYKQWYALRRCHNFEWRILCFCLIVF